MSALQQVILGYGGFAGPLDAWTTGLWSAVSLSRLLGSWNGGSFIGVNTTSSVSQTIGFNPNGSLDTTALAALAGANTVVVSNWLTQFNISPNGFAGTSAQRPPITTAGSFLGNIQFNGTANGLATGTASGGPTAFTVFFRGKLRSTSGTQIILEQSTNYNGADGAAVYYDAGALSVGVHDNAPSGYSLSNFSGTPPNDDVQCWRFDRSQATGATQCVLFVNGVKQTRSSNGDAGTLPGGPFIAGNWYMGARNLGSLFAQLNAHTQLIYESAISDADVASISTILAALP